MRFKNLLTRLVGKATFPPVLHTLFVLLFYLYFSVTEIGLYSSVYLALLEKTVKVTPKKRRKMTPKS